MSNPKYYGVLDSKYILEYEIGNGQSSKVYKAKDHLGNQFAIKVFEGQASSIQNEIELNQKIREFNIPYFIKYFFYSSGYLDTDDSEDFKNYIVFELASKGDLCDYIICNNTGFEDIYCKMLIYKIILAIQTLHRIGICHRDIKLENILVIGDNYEIKIGDFGSSFQIYEKNKKILQKEYVGTLRYMAPEIFEEKPYDGEKADIYSIGIVLFVLRNGVFPFRSSKIISQGSLKDKIYYYFTENSYTYYIWKGWGLEGLSTEFKQLFERMVALDPKKRPTIEEILEDDWMKEITHLTKDELKKLEQNLIKEFEKREEIIKKQKK